MPTTKQCHRDTPYPVQEHGNRRLSQPVLRIVIERFVMLCFSTRVAIVSSLRGIFKVIIS